MMCVTVVRDHLIHFNLSDYYADNMRKLETTKRWTSPQKQQISYRIASHRCNHVLNVYAYTHKVTSKQPASRFDDALLK